MDGGMDELSALKAATAAAGGAAGPSQPPSPPLSIASTALSNFDRAEEVTEAEKRKAEETTKFAAALAHFTAHITDLLRRVGGLDLLKIAAEMSTAPIDGEEEGQEDQTPSEARLSRREIHTLYQEAERVRVA